MAKIRFELPEGAESVSFEVEGRCIIATYESKRWRAERGEYYYYINSMGLIQFNTETHDSADNRLYEIGNYYQTYELAEKARDFVLQAYKHKHDQI